MHHCKSILFNDAVILLSYIASEMDERLWCAGGMIVTVGKLKYCGKKPVPTPLSPLFVYQPFGNWRTLVLCNVILNCVPHSTQGCYFNTCTVHFILFSKITNQSTITINL